MVLSPSFHPPPPPPPPPPPLLKELVSAVRPASAAPALAAAAPSAPIAGSACAICSFLCAVREPRRILLHAVSPPPLRRGIPSSLLLTESASTGRDEDGARSCTKAMMTAPDWTLDFTQCYVFARQENSMVYRNHYWHFGIFIWHICERDRRLFVRVNGSGGAIAPGCVRALCLMLSERVSRVCIVVLEEVEEDEPSPSPPPPQTKSSLEHRSHPVCRKAATHQDKVRSASQLASSWQLGLNQGLYHGSDTFFYLSRWCNWLA